MIDLAAPPFTLLAERDMDLLVLEEMLSSDPFKKWLVSKLYNGTRQFRRMIGAWHTPSLEPLGSVDILFVFEEISAGHKCAILIENKIDQPKQNLQAQRYFEFGEKGVEDGYWDEYLTCLFSPQAYFSSLEPSEYFSSYLSYEEIETWFSRAAAESHSATPQRSAYKKTLIRQAIEQGTGMMRRQMQTAAAAAPVYAPVPRQPAVPGREEAAAVLTQADITPQSVLPEQTKPAPEPVIQPKKKASASDFRVFPGGVFNLPAGYREAEDTIVGKFFADMQDFAKQYYPQLGMKNQPAARKKPPGLNWPPTNSPATSALFTKCRRDLWIYRLP